jgi:PHP family Zn ribbon phosphoesterase
LLREYKCDFHIHSCLSPCADLKLVPSEVLERAKLKGLAAIGLCDHNSAENVPAFKKAGERRKQKVLGGLEVTTCEEVHILALFDDDENLFKFQDIIYKNLPGENDEEIFGKQVVVNEEDQPIGINNRLLIGATLLSLEEVVNTIHLLKGIAIAAHIDRERFSLITQLGFIPEGLKLDGLEISPKTPVAKVKEDFPHLARFGKVTFSDAHYLDEIGKSSTSFFIKEISTEEIRKALFNEDGRYISAYS